MLEFQTFFNIKIINNRKIEGKNENIKYKKPG